MGYNREGANNILNSPKIIDNKPFYENVKNFSKLLTARMYDVIFILKN